MNKIVVDTETNGLDFARHEVVEVAWFNMDTGESDSFIPPHNVNFVLGNADPYALKINGYLDRIAFAPQDISWTKYRQFVAQMNGNTLAGSNPTFDARMLEKLGERAEIQGCPKPKWHHRLFDLSSYAKGLLKTDDLPGLATVCKMLGVENMQEHSAWADVQATVECFKILKELENG
jgi:DNA polymerase-3 subunit epsilon